MTLPTCTFRPQVCLNGKMMMGVGSQKTSRIHLIEKKTPLHCFISGVHVCQASTAYQRSHQCGKIISARKKNKYPLGNLWWFTKLTSGEIIVLGPSPGVTIAIQGKLIGTPGWTLTWGRPIFFLRFCSNFSGGKMATWRVVAVQRIANKQPIPREIWSCGIPKQCTIVTEIPQNYQTFALILLKWVI